jgi:hypothetical protein
MVAKFGNSQEAFPFNQCTFVFKDRTVRVAYAGTCVQALDQYYKSGLCTQDEVANILEIKEKNLRKAS